jgi:hypothetical protein
VHDGAEIILVGHRSTQWYSGSNNPPPLLIGAQNKTDLSRASHELSFARCRSGPRN